MAAFDTTQTVQPGSDIELARALADAATRGLKVCPRGGGTKSDWGAPPRRVDLVLSTSALDRVLEHAAGDMTATVQAGCTISALRRNIAQHGQRLALDPLFPDRATVGGILATNDSGALRHAFGSLRDLVLGVTVALPDGTLARSGGKVVKNVAGYDLPKLMTGALGTLGVITEATFRLHPLPAASAVFTATATTAEDALRLTAAVRGSSIAASAVQVSAARDAPWTVEVLVEASEAGVASAADALSPLARDHDLPPIASSSTGLSPRQRLWDTLSPGTVICKVTFLPSRLSGLCQSIEHAATGGWTMIAQSYGSALLRLDGSNPDAAAVTLQSLRRHVRVIEGSVTLLTADPELKRRVDPWDAPGDALPLMRRVKQQFDPTGVLNPGRFVGGL